MIPKSLSATAIATYEACPAAFKAMYVDRIRVGSAGPAAFLGTSIHEALETWVTELTQKTIDAELDLLLSFFHSRASQYNVPSSSVTKGDEMLKAWHERWMEYPPDKVLAIEVKETFPLRLIHPLTGEQVEIPVTYIWDRADYRERDHAIMVIDYKSWMQYVDGVEMKDLVQVRIYALAAAIRYKEMKPDRIWVVLDQLRYQPASALFSKDEIKEIWTYLKDVGLRILADDGETETVGPSCRWCPRALVCESLARARTIRAIPTLDDDEVAATLAELNIVKGWLDETMPQLRERVGEILENSEVARKTINGVILKITPKNERSVDSVRVATIIPEQAGRIGKIGIGALEELMKSDQITDEQRTELKKCITTTMTTSVNAKFSKK